jgi:uncharacterized protein YbaP (TraB family)
MEYRTPNLWGRPAAGYGAASALRMEAYMKRFFLPGGILFVMSLFAACASLQAGEPSVSSVWALGRDGKQLFLGGSCHLLRKNDFPLPAVFDMAFDRSNILVLETDPGKMTDPETLRIIQTRTLLPEDGKLDSVLSGEVYKLLEQEFQKFGLPSLESLDRFKPAMVMMMLSTLDMQQSGFIEQGIDQHYFDRAKQSGKPLDFFETAEFQIDTILAMGEGYEDDFVRYSLLDRENTGKYLDELVAEWRAGGAEFMNRELALLKDLWPAIYQSLIADRNARWLPRIEEYITTEPVEFVIVGLAHLHGPEGLLRQLQDRGYTVELFNNQPGY